MLPELEAIAAGQHGVFLRSQALMCGYNDEDIRRLVRAGQWTRIRWGSYVPAALWDSLDATARHVLLLRAVMLRVDEPAVASHCSASAATGLPTWGTDLSRAHLTRPWGHFGRTQAGVTHHEATLLPADIIDLDGIACTSLRRTALDVARGSGFRAGVVCADAALRRGVEPEALQDLADLMASWPGSRAIPPVVRFADGGAETPGESLARIFVVSIGLPRPRTQVVFTHCGFTARVDMLVEEYGWVLEFDGRTKYRRSRDDCDPVIDEGDIVWAEKQREDRLRELDGVRAVSRLVWSDLFGARRDLAAHRLWTTAERLGVRRPHRRVA